VILTEGVYVKQNTYAILHSVQHVTVEPTICATFNGRNFKLWFLELWCCI